MTAYTIERQDSRLLLTLAGDLIANIVAGLQGALRDALDTAVEEVVVDLKKTAMLDSSGIGLLIAISNTITRRKGRVRVLNVSPDILQLLQSMRLADRLNASGAQA